MAILDPLSSILYPHILVSRAFGSLFDLPLFTRFNYTSPL